MRLTEIECAIASGGTSTSKTEVECAIASGGTSTSMTDGSFMPVTTLTGQPS